MTLVKINGAEYPASIEGRLHNEAWDGRESKTITLEMAYEDGLELFCDGCSWSIICEDPGEEEGTFVRSEFDNSDFNVAGDITDHRDGTISVTMGKMTDLEEAYELLYGGE